MGYNLPDGCTQSDIDRAYGDDDPEARYNAECLRADDEYDGMTVVEIMADLHAGLEAARRETVDAIWSAVDTFGATKKPVQMELRSEGERTPGAAGGNR